MSARTSATDTSSAGPVPAGSAPPHRAESVPGTDFSAAQLLLTLLGDYWFASSEHIASAALVTVLAEFGISGDAARAALSRLCREGRIERVRDGRHTAYALTPSTRVQAADRGRDLAAFGAEPVTWDGWWTCVAFSVPETDRHRRSVLRTRLRSLGLGLLFDGLWITPHAPLDKIDAVLVELQIAGAAVLRAQEVPRPAGTDLLRAWDLTAVHTGYDVLIIALKRIDRLLRNGSVGPAEALIARTSFMDNWRKLARTDPRLPDSLLAPGWPKTEATRRFVAAYDALGPLAELRMRQLVGVTGDGPGGPRHHRIDDLR